MAGGGGGARCEARPLAAQVSTTGLGRQRMARMTAPLDRRDENLHRSGLKPTLSRRAWLIGGGVAATLVGAGLVRRWRGERASVFIAKNQAYRGDLVRTIRDGLVACGFAAESIR